MSTNQSTRRNTRPGHTTRLNTRPGHTTRLNTKLGHTTRLKDMYQLRLTVRRLCLLGIFGSMLASAMEDGRQFPYLAQPPVPRYENAMSSVGDRGFAQLRSEETNNADGFHHQHTFAPSQGLIPTLGDNASAVSHASAVPEEEKVIQTIKLCMSKSSLCNKKGKDGKTALWRTLFSKATFKDWTLMCDGDATCRVSVVDGRQIKLNRSAIAAAERSPRTHFVKFSFHESNKPSSTGGYQYKILDEHRKKHNSVEIPLEELAKMNKLTMCCLNWSEDGMSGSDYPKGNRNFEILDERTRRRLAETKPLGWKPSQDMDWSPDYRQRRR